MFSISKIKSHLDNDLSHWILFLALEFCHIEFLYIYNRIPLWSSIKLVCACWLALPPFRGAHYAYEGLIRGRFLKHERVYGKSLHASQQKLLDLLSPQATESLEHYIKEHGTNALDNVIVAVRSLSYSAALFIIRVKGLFNVFHLFLPIIALFCHFVSFFV